MKYIKKGKEPSSFTAWKKEQQLKNHTPNWKRFKQSVKNDVFDALLREQGYICCYCGSRISRNKCHIEHLKPKGIDTYKHLMFEYTNLLASCQCESESEAPPPVPVHCGHKKGHWIDELTDEERQKLVQGFEQPDAKGQYQEFWGAIAYILKQYFIA